LRECVWSWSDPTIHQNVMECGLVRPAHLVGHPVLALKKSANNGAPINLSLRHRAFDGIAIFAPSVSGRKIRFPGGAKRAREMPKIRFISKRSQNGWCQTFPKKLHLGTQDGPKRMGRVLWTRERGGLIRSGCPAKNRNTTLGRLNL
jgi:hypothetical protein